MRNGGSGKYGIRDICSTPLKEDIRICAIQALASNEAAAEPNISCLLKGVTQMNAMMKNVPRIAAAAAMAALNNYQQTGRQMWRILDSGPAASPNGFGSDNCSPVYLD